MDGVAKHRTERGSAGSNTTNTLENGVDPALPRSVLCLLNTVRSSIGGQNLRTAAAPTYNPNLCGALV